MRAKATPPLILVVDDNEDSRELYADYFDVVGFRVASARHGAEAVRHAQALRPDVIVMDLTMPIMDGWAATRLLRANPRTARIPIIALTGHGFPGAADIARAAGCDRYLVKPCVPADLALVVRELLAARPAPRRRTA